MEHIKMLRENVIKEIGLGFQFVFDKSIINKLPDAVVTPYGVACQSTINDLMELITKYRPTHNLSNEESPNNSVNDCLERDDLPELFYGWCLSRLLHYIHALRMLRPDIAIVISKVDIKAAHRRCTQRSDLACMSITSIDDFAVMILREPFGGAVCPFSFRDIVSEPATDLGNDLLASDWDETKFYSPYVEKLDPPTLLDTSVPFGQALPADVVVPPSLHGKMDDFIDDIITAEYADSNWKR